MLFYHPAHYPLALASGALRIPWLHRRTQQPVIPEGELYVHDILRIIDEHKLKELEQNLALSPQESDPDAPNMLSQQQQHRLFRRLITGFAVFGLAMLYGSGTLPM